MNYIIQSLILKYLRKHKAHPCVVYASLKFCTEEELDKYYNEMKNNFFSKKA